MKQKPNSKLFQRVAAKRGVSYRRAIRICAANGGRKSGQKRRLARDKDQPPLL